MLHANGEGDTAPHIARPHLAADRDPSSGRRCVSSRASSPPRRAPPSACGPLTNTRGSSINVNRIRPVFSPAIPARPRGVWHVSVSSAGMRHAALDFLASSTDHGAACGRAASELTHRSLRLRRTRKASVSLGRPQEERGGVWPYHTMPRMIRWRVAERLSCGCNGWPATASLWVVVRQLGAAWGSAGLAARHRWDWPVG